MRFFKNANYNFLRYEKQGLALACLAIAIGTVSLVARRGPNLGIDFTGGAQIVYGFSKTPNEDQIRKIVEAANVKVVSVQRYDKPERNQVLLRVPMEKKEGRDVSREVTAALTQALNPAGAAAGVFDLNLNGADLLLSKLLADDPEHAAQRPSVDPRVEYLRTAQTLIQARSEKGLFTSVDEAAKTPGISPMVAEWLRAKTVAGPFTLLSAESVGPQAGKDLREKGMWAIVLSWLAMLTYIAWRFRALSFGTMAMVSLINNVWITLGVCSLIDLEISLTVVASFLTLVGYSVNDTVVIFDRIREIRQTSRRLSLREAANRALNETLSRTILTAGCTLIALLVLFFMGGSVLRDFAFVMLLGIVVGTYSTIFVAVPLVLIWEEWKARRSAVKAASAAAPVKPGKAAAKAR